MRGTVFNIDKGIGRIRENRNSCLILFNSISDSNELSLPFILSAKKWKLVQSLKDGAIYVTDSTLTQGR